MYLLQTHQRQHDKDSQANAMRMTVEYLHFVVLQEIQFLAPVLQTRHPSSDPLHPLFPQPKGIHQYHMNVTFKVHNFTKK